MNKKIISTISIYTACLLCTACLFDSSSDTITGRYKVLWIDLHEQQFICEEPEGHPSGCLTLVPEYVFAVGHNDDYIIAKQHPTSGFENGFKINTAVTNYYIIDMHKELETEDKVIGPLTMKQFEQRRKELQISEIKFDMVYPDVP